MVDKAKGFVVEKIVNILKLEVSVAEVLFKEISKKTVTFNAQVSGDKP